MNETKKQHRRSFSGRAIVLAFSVCALADFAWSMYRGRSVVESVLSAILALFGTAWYVLAMWASSHNDPDNPNEPARWGP